MISSAEVLSWEAPHGTVLDVDDDLLAEAAKIFGTTTKKATVNAALRAAVNQKKRREFANRLKSGGLPDLIR